MASNHHNLSTVIWFEFIRTIKKPSFWVATLSIPVLIGVVFAVVFYSSKSTSDNSDKLAKEKFSIEYVDESKVILPQVSQAVEAKQVTDKDQALEDVKSGKVDAFFYYPGDVSKQKVEVYCKDVGLFDNGKYQAVAENLLKVSANTKIGDPQLTAIAQNQISYDTVTYKADGNVSAGWLAAIPPLIFLVLFYFTIAMLGNNLLNSTVEEKENRVTEMILTTMNPTDLIVGKLLATFMAGILQAIVLLVPVIAAYLILGTEASVANLPSLDMIKGLVFDPYSITIAALIFIGGMLLFTGTLVAVGAIMPTAKEAGQYFGIAIMLMFVPFYIIMLILSDPNALIVQIFTYFPFTAPVTALLRNAFGSLSMTDAIIVITELFILGLIIIRLSVKLFRYGAMEYSGRLSLSTLFNKD